MKLVSKKDGKEVLKVLSDQEGAFVMQDVACGMYSLSPSIEVRLQSSISNVVAFPC